MPIKINNKKMLIYCLTVILLILAVILNKGRITSNKEGQLVAVDAQDNLIKYEILSHKSYDIVLPEKISNVSLIFQYQTKGEQFVKTLPLYSKKFAADNWPWQRDVHLEIGIEKNKLAPIIIYTVRKHNGINVTYNRSFADLSALLEPIPAVSINWTSQAQLLKPDVPVKLADISGLNGEILIKIVR